MRKIQAADGPSGFAFRNITIVVLFLVIAIFGAFFAYRDLSQLWRERNTMTLKLSREIQRMSDDNDKLRSAEATQKLSRPDARPANSPTAEAISVSHAERMSTLLSFAKVMTAGNNRLKIQRLQRQAEIIARGRQLGFKVPDLENVAYLVLGDYRLPKRFGELFGLEDGQVAKLQNALDSADEAVGELSAAMAQIRNNGNASYTLEVGALPEALVARERTQMITTFRQVLGEDGYQAFALLNGESSDPKAMPGGPGSFFNAFGSIGRTATISKTPDGKYRYQIRSGTNSGSNGSVSNMEELRKKVGGVIKLLPTGF